MLGNASVALYVGSGGSFCKLQTHINDADSHGIYWCPFPKCSKKSRKRSLLKDHMKKTHHGPFYCTPWCPFPKCSKKSRKRSLLKDHMKKTHHGPFYCTQCGVNFLHSPSLHRHLRKWGHSEQSDLVPKESIRRHTVAAVEMFSVCLHEAFATSSDYILG